MLARTLFLAFCRKCIPPKPKSALDPSACQPADTFHIPFSTVKAPEKSNLIESIVSTIYQESQHTSRVHRHQLSHRPINHLPTCENVLQPFPTGQRPHLTGRRHTKTLLQEVKDQVLLGQTGRT